MKKIIFILSVLLFSGANAQQEKGIFGPTNWLNNWTEFKPGKSDYGEANQILAGNIATNTKLLKRNIYVLEGNVYVTNNAILTIEPGTLIIGDFESKGALLITKGASIIADGLETDPIVFTSNRTSRKAGDWGGIVLLGDAPINKFGSYSAVNYDLDSSLTTYGGVNSNSNSGILRYVRIEFAGKKVKGSNFNSLLLAGVGNKTILDHVMVSYSAGDSFEILGGEVSLNKMVSFKCSNVDFRFSQGAQCQFDNSLAIRSSFLTSSSGSRCMEILSFDKKEEADLAKKQTFVTATNITLVNDSEDVERDTNSGLIKEAVYVGENVSLTFKKSIISGFNPAVIFNSNIAINDVNLNKLKFVEMYFNFCKGHIFTENNSNNEDLEGWYGKSIFFNLYQSTDNNETFVDFKNERRPDYRMQLSKFTAASK
jgi:hypothetical protein